MGLIMKNGIQYPGVGSGEGSGLEISQLDDVKIVPPLKDGDKLIYDKEKGKWVNTTKYHKYSTEEQIVGEWINGKPIYEKTFIVPDFNFPQSKDFTDDLFINIEFILSAQMYDTTSTTVRFVPVGARKASSNTIRLYNYNNWDSIDAYTLQYTKTTD